MLTTPWNYFKESGVVTGGQVLFYSFNASQSFEFIISFSSTTLVLLVLGFVHSFLFLIVIIMGLKVMILTLMKAQLDVHLKSHPVVHANATPQQKLLTMILRKIVSHSKDLLLRLKMKKLFNKKS